jgi:hypothetical protein
MTYPFVLLYNDGHKQEITLTCDSIEEAKEQQRLIIQDYNRDMMRCIILFPVREISS